MTRMGEPWPYGRLIQTWKVQLNRLQAPALRFCRGLLLPNTRLLTAAGRFTRTGGLELYQWRSETN